jgi:hypothetical protein
VSEEEGGITHQALQIRFLAFVKATLENDTSRF